MMSKSSRAATLGRAMWALALCGGAFVFCGGPLALSAMSARGQNAPTPPEDDSDIPSAPLTAETLAKANAQRARLADEAAKFEEIVKLQGEGRYDEAIVLAKEVAAIEKEVHGERHRDYAQSLNDLAVLYGEKGDYANSERLYLQALALRKEIVGEHDADYAQSLTGLGDVYNLGADYERAEPLYQQATDIYKELHGEKNVDYAAGLSNLAGAYEGLGDFARAESLLRQSMEIYKQVVGEQDADYAGSVELLAGIYRKTGRYTQSERLFRQALEIRKALHGEKDPFYALTLNSLGVLYSQMGDNARAEPLIREALSILQEVLGERSDVVATSLNNLAEVYSSTGDYARAEELFKQALEISKETHGDQHPDYALELENLAATYHLAGDSVRAEAAYLEAVAIGKKYPGPSYAITLNNLGQFYLDANDLAKAAPLYEESAKITKQFLGEQHPSYASSCHNLAKVYYLQHDFERARLLFRQAFEIASHVVDENAVGRDETTQLRLASSLQHILERYMDFLVHWTRDAETTYEVVLNWKGATLVRQRAVRQAAANSQSAALVQKLQGVVRQWSALSAGAQNDPRRQQRLAELTEEKRRLEEQLSEQSAEFHAATARLTLAELQQTLPADAALVDYFEYESTKPWPDGKGGMRWGRSIAAFVVRNGSRVEMFDLGEAEPVAAEIDRWRAGYGAATADSAEAGKLLRDAVWSPLLRAIGDARLVLISPDGALGKLPFAALPGDKPSGYLIEDVTLALVPVPRLIPLLPAAGEHVAHDRELLLLAGVDYDRRDAVAAPSGAAVPDEDLVAIAQSRGAARQTADGLHWSALPGTAGEAKSIAEMFRTDKRLSEGAVTLLSGAAATEEEFRELAPRSRILHVATHGFFAAEGKRSALAVDGLDAPQAADSRGQTATHEEFPPGLL